MDAGCPVGFIGLGTMGEAMALTLVKAGTRLLVWNRTRAEIEILGAAGAEVAREAADVFAHSATVFLMLVDGGAIGTVRDRGGAAFAARVTGRTVVHMGTTSPAYSRVMRPNSLLFAAVCARLNSVVAVGVYQPMPGRVAYRVYELL